MLTQREKKGYEFEVEVQEKLIEAGFPRFKANPVNPTEWKRKQRKGPDIILEDIEIECKHVDAKIFPSWIKRDWIPRFTDRAKYKIVVYKGDLKLTEEGKNLLKENRIILFTLKQLISFLKWLRQIPKFLIKDRVTNLLKFIHDFSVFSFILMYIKTLFSGASKGCKVFKYIKDKMRKGYCFLSKNRQDRVDAKSYFSFPNRIIKRKKLITAIYPCLRIHLSCITHVIHLLACLFSNGGENFASYNFAKWEFGRKEAI
ncbi:MAG: hypothetical protein ACTSX6_11615 [Candidatus Heimdallarchaeaceae archaeon]